MLAWKGVNSLIGTWSMFIDVVDDVWMSHLDPHYFTKWILLFAICKHGVPKQASEHVLWDCLGFDRQRREVWPMGATLWDKLGEQIVKASSVPSVFDPCWNRCLANVDHWRKSRCWKKVYHITKREHIVTCLLLHYLQYLLVLPSFIT